MKVKTKKRQRTPATAQQKLSSAVAWLTTPDAYEMLCTSGYTSLDQNPEVLTACRKIAQMISSMTLYLMANTERGDRRIINELSRAVDINPNSYMTRRVWMEGIVMNLLLHGHGNSVVFPHTTNGLLGDLEPIDPQRVGFLPDGRGYRILIDGTPYDPSELLHFVLNPDPRRPWMGRGLTTALKDVANNLKQAAATERGFMESKWKPSIIVKVDGLIDEFSDPEGRKKLLDDYVATNKAGEPWLIPADQFSVEQVRPLSLSDLAISDVVQLDKRTIASIIGVPPFVLGVGSYNKDEWNDFVNGEIRFTSQIIEQELTRKTLISPKMYWKFNPASLYSYDLRTTAEVYGDLRTKGIVSGNEVRDKIGMEPREGLDDLEILENYIPVSKVGDQLKLKQGGKEDA